ncbi:MAG: response regulator, partial [Gammaproteobacteria bacterium]|nr:response regulator [Gammaproteobacteria bacterium]
MSDSFLPAADASSASAESDVPPQRRLFLLQGEMSGGPSLFPTAVENALSREVYRLDSFRDAASLFDALKKNKPFAVLVDKDYADPQHTGLTVASSTLLGNQNIPGILIASENDMESRLTAVRAGVHHYLTKPVNIDQLENMLSRATHGEQEAPYRILVVDDDELLRGLFELTLKRAGLEVNTLPHANNIVEEVHAFQPELIFMDVQMPGASGPEAASVIRQIPEFDVIPIVYLSGNTELDLQLAALTLGGDDFLTKPVDSTHLVVTATARATRTRGLQQTQRRLMHTAQELQSYQRLAEHEQHMAQQLMNRMIFSKDLEDESMQYWHQPASRFSGDLV